ncbi:hypothetical protein EON81_08560 [bacterium]|nr:MAG: hypothetical protein EON81_08560 [bacterium]
MTKTTRDFAFIFVYYSGAFPRPGQVENPRFFRNVFLRFLAVCCARGKPRTYNTSMPSRFVATVSAAVLAGFALAQTTAPVGATPFAFQKNVQALPQIVVRLKDGISPQLFAATRGLKVVRPFASRGDTWVMAARSVADATAQAAQTDTNVVSVYQDAVLPIRLRWEPNDPLYNPGTPSGASGQWHLRNVNNLGGFNIDSRVWEAWQRDLTGTGVRIAICDDSIEKNHPDLLPNFDSVNSYDWVGGDTDPSPTLSAEGHGISVAGVAVARGGNGIGVTGAAPLATLVGLRLPFYSAGTTASAFEDAIRYRSTGTSPTIQIKNHSYGFSQPYVNDPTEVAALADSIAAGTIHVWAAGNDRKGTGSLGENEDANKASTQAVPGQVVVAAIAENNRFAYYSSYGANVTVTAPSSSSTRGITTTDRTGSLGDNGLTGYPDYTNRFGGTSSAAPLVTGILGLAKQAQPALNGRFAKHLLAISSDIVDSSDATAASDGGWRTNSAGIAFNQNYGFGMINADRLTAAAVRYSGVTALTTTDTGTVNVNGSIPDNNAAGITRTFTVGTATPIEEAVITLNITHARRGDVEAYLTSPSGLKSRLLVKNADDGESMTAQTWTALTNAFWGENPQGTWKLTVVDGYAGNLGTLRTFRAQTRHGSLIAKTIDGSAFVSQTASTFAPGERKSVRFRFRNTGSTTWTPTTYRLKADAATAAAWGLASRAVAATTAPDGTTEFAFYVTAPTTTGSKPWKWQMEGPGGVFGPTNSPTTLSVGSFNSEFVSQTVPAFAPGERKAVRFRFKNTGSEPWTTAAYRLRASTATASAWGLATRILSAETAVNGTTEFAFYLTAPTVPGTYPFVWQVEGPSGVFGATNSPATVTVSSDDSSFVSQRNIPATIARGATFDALLTFKNTGGSSWIKANGYLFRSVNPLLNTTWGSDRQYFGTEVAPGATAELRVRAVAPSTAGTYTFSWSLGKTDGTVFGQPSTPVRIVVQ